MGVTGLWTVVQPCARPIKIETLNKKRLAVDASIWIYQFLKAVRDKEGNALRNSHIVGFFRRICKLLFFGIKPVFVFDGGAPVLKRQTIANRKARREGRREDAVRTAGKLLAIQMQRVAEDEEKKRKEKAMHPREEPDEEIPENLVYADEVLQTQQERLRNRTFKKKDQYHLPELGASLSEMGAQNDPRIMSLEELEEYARQFDRGEDINVYDFSKIDFDSPFFMSLPAADRYNILNAARLRSRLRLGYSKDQLDAMFPDRMAFSKFQIERVAERNDLTQRLMNLNGMSDDISNTVNRIASERGREYVLVKNDGVEGGWALGVVSNKDEGQPDKPIDVDRESPREAEDEDWEDDEFEDVPIEGLNRLPKPRPGPSAQQKASREFLAQELEKRRRKVYGSRKRKSPQLKPSRARPVEQDPNSLFLAEENEEEEWETVPISAADNDETPEAGDNEEQEQLRKAIAMSLGQDVESEAEKRSDSDEDDAYREVFQQERVPDTAPFSKGSGIAIARQANQRSNKALPRAPFNQSDSEDDEMDLQAALTESWKTKRPTVVDNRVKRKSPTSTPRPNSRPISARSEKKNAAGFSGPLPFESLDLGSSILGKKKMQKIEQDTAGGFVRELGPGKNNDSSEPLPPWFTGDRDMRKELEDQRSKQKQDWAQARKDQEEEFQFESISRLRKHDTQEIIDVDAPSTQEKSNEVIMIDSDQENDDIEMKETADEKDEMRVDVFAREIQASPPEPLTKNQPSPPKRDPGLMPQTEEEEELDDEPIEWSESETEVDRQTKQNQSLAQSPMRPAREPSKSPSPKFEDVPLSTVAASTVSHEPSAAEFAVDLTGPQAPKSPSPDFEDIPVTTAPSPPTRRRRSPSPFQLQGPDDLAVPIVEPTELPEVDHPEFPMEADDSDQYSDPGDAELFASLTAEAEEHARFAQELNSASGPINFEAELKQLRAQQKKDRRDADEVTQTMISECQHLLTLFGLPYVTAPMEAEAQCSELVSLGLVDGIVTDDSDTFLFGGTRVYKNMFNAAKFVECYLSQDLEREFSLTRKKLIDIAQLLGSDYTVGIPGIGPVTALEILSEFGDLADFSTWWRGVQDGSIPASADSASPFRRRFRRRNATKLFLPAGFPDPRVAEAYLEPLVDDDPQPFVWGVPDLDALRSFLSSQIGWSPERTDEVLVPVIRDMNRREKEGTQSNITRFFDGGVGAGAFAPRQKGTSRMGKALTRLREKELGKEDADAMEGSQDVGDVAQKRVSGTRKRKGATADGDATAITDGLRDVGEEEEEDDYVEEPRKKARNATARPKRGKVTTSTRRKKAAS